MFKLLEADSVKNVQLSRDEDLILFSQKKKSTLNKSLKLIKL